MKFKKAKGKSNLMQITNKKIFFVTVALLFNCSLLRGGEPTRLPDLIYDPQTGGVVLVPHGWNITTFNLQSDGGFNPVFSQEDLIPSTFGVPGLTDNTPNAIGWVSAIAAGGNGFGDRPEDQGGAFLGNIFPTGLGAQGLSSLVTVNAWAGPNGTSGKFCLGGLGCIDPIVPEPSTLALFCLGLIGYPCFRRRSGC